MNNKWNASFQEVLDIVESLPEHQQDDLIDIIRRRRIDFKREILSENIKEARAEFARGEIRRGNANDLMKEIKE
ncbi:MAG: hypothetical protein AB1656_10575 [Candidatus Omnitrophota bacterium]